MGNSNVQLQPDSSGKKVQTYENTIDGQTVQTQAVAIVGADGLQAVQVPTFTNETTAGTVSAGATSVTFISSSDFTGSILDSTFPASAAISYDSAIGKTLGALVYTVDAGTLSIAKVV